MPDKSYPSKGISAISAARSLFDAYRSAIGRLDDALGPPFVVAVDLILAASGHVVVCGMGKSGLIGRKIAATLASTGTPSLFLHPAEAIHGDLGMVRSGDVIILISNSGETEEIVRLLPAFARLDAQIVALTAVADSSMANAARIVLDISVDREACPLNLAPTTSTLNTLVLGDALSVALMEARGFNMSDFAMTHPGGALGRRLLTYVKDQMRTNNLPFVAPDAPMQDAIMVMTEGRIGMALVGDASSLNKVDIASVTAGEVANPKPLTIKGTTLMVDAEARMQESRVQCLVVTNDDGHVEGIIQIFE